MEDGALESLERIADALEKLADDAVVEIEGGPPVCPHCGQYDPEIIVKESESKGKLSSYVVEAECDNCGAIMYVVIDSYSMHMGLDTVRNEIEARAGAEDE